jgi:hypothetical protein
MSQHTPGPWWVALLAFAVLAGPPIILMLLSMLGG